MLLNRERAEEVMRANGLNALVAATPENVLYLSDYEMAWAAFAFGGKAFAILPAAGDGEPTLVCPAYGLAYLSERPTWMPHVKAFGTHRVFIDEGDGLDDFERVYSGLLATTAESPPVSHQVALFAALRDLGLAGGRLGVDDLGALATLRDEFPRATVEDARGTFRLVRAVKTPEESDRLRRGARANEAGIRSAMSLVMDGINYRELGNAWRQTVTSKGGQPEFWYSGGGRRAAGLFPTQDFRLRSRDPIRFECGGRFERYWFDTGRTASVGEGSQKLVKRYTAIQRAHEEVESLIGPGRRAAELPERLIATIRRLGIPEFEGTAWGHGLGLEAYDLPRVTLDSDDVLEVGMVFALETPFFELGWGGIQLEDTYLVTEGGFERLTALSRELFESTEQGGISRV